MSDEIEEREREKQEDSSERVLSATGRERDRESERQSERYREGERETLGEREERETE